MAVRDLLGPLATRTLPELSQALRNRIPRILDEWVAAVQQNIPVARKMSFDEVVDSVPAILRDMADAFIAGTPDEIAPLLNRSPLQGIHRYGSQYDVAELVGEDRILRKLIVQHVTEELTRDLSLEESLALHWAIDLVSHQALMAYVTNHNQQMREAAESELKYLAFLSHDLRGHLSNVTLWLNLLQHKLSAPEELSYVEKVQQAIKDTASGMERMLQSQQLRHQTQPPKPERVDLKPFVAAIIQQQAHNAQEKLLELLNEVADDTSILSDRALLRLVLQNLIGNAIKYSTQGSVRVWAENLGGRWAISVTDEGAGISPAHLQRIFNAFERGEMHGQQGIGLGLAIASQAARLLNAELSVQSELGKGSAFTLALPPEL